MNTFWKQFTVIMFLILNLLLISGLSWFMYETTSLIATLDTKIDIYEQYRQNEFVKVRDLVDHLHTMRKLQSEWNKLSMIYTDILKDKQAQLEIDQGVLDFNYQELKKSQRKVENNLEQTDLYNVENIKQANFILYNETRGSGGSGTHIKIDGKSYILTCAHLIDEVATEKLVVIDDEGDWLPIELVKYNRKKDLALFRFFGAEDLPYLEIGKEAPKVGSKVLVIGNPDSLTDVLSDGIISQIEDNHYLVTNKIYYGNSGGALLYKGKVVGVMSKLLINFMPPVFVSYGEAVGLADIITFLEGSTFVTYTNEVSSDK